MARSVTTSSLFSATAMGATKKRPFRHVTDSEFARSLAMKQQVEGVKSPHSSDKSTGLPVKRSKK